MPLVLSGVFTILFIWVELYIAPEPVLAPFLLKQKIPVLVGISNFLVATCNFSVMYNYSLSNLAHKSAELNEDGSVADTDATTGTDEAQDRGLASLSASLLSGEHE